jgi:hypothetical protein
VLEKKKFKVTVFLEVIDRFNTIPIKIADSLYRKKKKNYPKIHMKAQNP